MCSDWRMMPMITLCLMINYLDRSNVTNGMYGADEAKKSSKRANV